MSSNDILNELNSIEASASLVVERCQKLKLELGPVSTGSSKKTTSLSDEEKARLRERKKANRRKIK